MAPGGTVLALPPPMYRQEEPRSKVFVVQPASESISPENGAPAGLEKPAPPQAVVPAAVVYLSDRGPWVVVVVLDVVVLAIVLVVGAAVVVVVVGAAVDVEVVAAPVVVVSAPVVVVVAAAVVVVVLTGAPHVPPGPHASQQLGTDPTHAVPPGGGSQADSLLLIEQLVLPLLLVRQQVTKPGLPQVDRDSQDITAPEHGGRSDPSSTASSVTISTQST